MSGTEKPRVRVNKHGLVADGFANFVAGVGAGNFKTSQAQYVESTSPYQADAAFRTSTWYGKILTIPADDAVKEWRKWKATKEQIRDIENEEKRLLYKHVVHRALLMSRHEGGALVVPGGLPGSLSSPLDISRIGKNSVTFLHVLSRDEVTAGPIVRDPLDRSYGMPEYWEIRSSSGTAPVRLHSSRAVPINGRHVPGGVLRRGEFWGDSIWLHLADAVIAADSGHAIISALMHEAKIDVVSVPDMAVSLASSEGEASMVRRWEIAARLKSLSGIMLIDGGPSSSESTKKEEWNQKQMRWDGLSDVMRTLLTILSGAADIPYTRLTGDQQKGLSNNDEGSMRNYYSAVNTQQVLHIEPMLRPLDEILRMSAIGTDDPEIWYTWSPLYQMSETELSANDKTDADTLEVLQRTALIPSDVLATLAHNRMIESGRWPGIEEAIKDIPDDWEAGIPPTPPAPDGNPAPDPSVQRDAAPMTLYVRRDVLNWRDIEKWAKSSGVETTLGSKMHVTVVYSRQPVDWMSIEEAWQEKIELPPGGPRLLDRFGPDGRAKVILFRSSAVEWRHRQILEAGASSDHEGFQPHITYTYGDVPDDIEPYTGVIVLGPEIFEEIDDNWSEKLTEDGLG